MPHSPFFSSDDSAEIGACLRLLSVGFRFSPESAEAGALIGLIRDGELSAAWPFGTESGLEALNRHMAENLEIDGMCEAYCRLFVGPEVFEAPAWGSVYLDRESVLFGSSTLALRAFLAREGAALNTGMNEPEDHIGLVLWLASDFLLAGKTEALAALLSEHILPWSGRYLELLKSHAGHPFYQGLAELTGLTLAELADEMKLMPVTKPLYR